MITLSRVRNSYKVRRGLAIGREVLIDPFRAAIRRAFLSRKIRKLDPVWLHFGCGEIADSRFVNVDARVFSHVDYVTKSALMPAIPKNTADMIYACHVFEHLPFSAQKRVLRRWYDLLRSGGELRLSVPDFDRVISHYSSGKRNFDWVQPVLMGGQDYPGNFHFALFTEAKLKDLLEDAGFSNVRWWKPLEQEGWPRDWSWDESLSLNLCALKP